MYKLKYKRQMYSWWPWLYQLYRVYKKLIKEDENFEWSFYSFIWKTQFVKSYIINKINSLDFILLCKIDKLNKLIKIEYFYISSETFVNPNICQALNIQLNEYKILYGYDKVTIIYSYERYSQKIKKIMTSFLDFNLDIDKDLLSSIKNISFNKIILTKKL